MMFEKRCQRIMENNNSGIIFHNIDDGINILGSGMIVSDTSYRARTMLSINLLFPIVYKFVNC